MQPVLPRKPLCLQHTYAACAHFASTLCPLQLAKLAASLGWLVRLVCQSTQLQCDGVEEEDKVEKAEDEAEQEGKASLDWLPSSASSSQNSQCP